MIDFRPVLQIVGWLLVALALAMLPPAAVDLAAGDPEWVVFALSSGLTLFIGLALEVGMRSSWRRLTVRQVYLTTALGWMALCAFAALPFAFGKAQLAATDALFEATCGLTATGASVLAALDRLPPGLLVWRALLQWLGGAGALAMAVAVLPALQVGGMQIFRIEMLGGGDKATPRAARLGILLASIYAGLTLAICLLLWLAGMPGFDALLHAMTTLSTGGFSTWDTSLGHYNNPRIDLVVVLGMVIGGMPILALAQIARGQPRTLWKDGQLRWYFAILAAATLSVAGWLAADQNYNAASALRHAAVSVVSAMTGTGFSTLDYSQWSGLPVAVLLFAALLGGCAGSTTGGIKIFRLQLLLAAARVQISRLLRPHAVLIAHFNRRPIPVEALESVMGFLFVYALAFAALAMALGLLGLDFVAAVSGAVGALTNFGPGLGPVVGPAGSFGLLSDPAKWLLGLGMLFGRLEMFPLLVLFIPSFWEQ